ncbi:MAG: pitrilysin family protein [Thermodesulfobacteriota bacterium]
MKDYQRLKLENGMTLILKENRSAPVVALQMWVKAGSGDETDREAGICHIIEHMLFKGTEKRGVGEIAYEIESSGGEINAYTSFDETVYHIVIASRFFDLGLDVLSDAVRHPSFNPTELEKEKEVIMEEIKRCEDQPMVKLTQALFSTSYNLHTYRRPIIGFEDTVKSFTRGNLLDFYKRWYTPSNITLIVVGDIENTAVSPKIELAFKDFTSNQGTSQGRVQELPQKTIRSSVMIDNVMEGYMSAAFHIPGINHKDTPALDILSFILGNGDSSRLYKEVKDRKGLVYNIYSYSFMPKEPGLLVITSVMESEKSRDALAAILEETYRLKSEKINDNELEKAKLNIESEFLYGKETVQGQARQLGHFDVVAENINFEKEYINLIYKVKNHDIMRAAKRYLKNENLTAVFLLPHGNGDDINEDLIKDIASKKESKSRCRYPKPCKKGVEQIEKITMENGMTLLIKEDHSTPIVAMRAVFLGGLRFEKKRLNGVNNFIAEMLTKGTRDRNALEIAQLIESTAGSIHGFSGRNSFGLTSEILSRFFDTGLRLFSDIIINPTFDQAELEKERTDILAALKQQEDNLASYTFNIFAKTLYNYHPYGMNILGTKESILNMTRNDLIDYYRTYASPKNLVLSIVGDVRADDTIKKVKQFFQDFAATNFKIPKILKEAPPECIKNVEEYKDKKQAHIVLGFLGTTIYSPDRYALEVLNTVLSGQGGRLFMELRDKLSLAYAVASFFQDGIDPGFIGVYIGTSPEKLDTAIDGIKKELKKVREKKIDSAELERARRYLLGSFEIGLQTNSAKSATMAFGERYGLGYSYFMEYPERIAEVTNDDVLRVARKYLDLDRYSLAVVSPPRGSVCVHMNGLHG